MSQTGKVVLLGTLAASAMLVGAIQFASGHDLASDRQVQVSDNASPAAESNNVNRAAKSDRAGVVAEAPATQTVSIKLSAFADTSFLLRLPVANPEARSGRDDVPQGKSIISTEGERRQAKRPIACEPSVSVLTEIAKRLQPGRCIT
jgi:hypothetical protein